MKAATIYQRDKKIYIHSLSKTTADVWILTPPIIAFEIIENEEIGKNIKLCLENSREKIQHPVSFGNINDPLLAVAGVKTFYTFAKSAKCVEVEMADGQEVTLIPTRNGGSRDGFVPLADKAIDVIGSDSDLGSAVIKALAKSE